jgi:voltage-gated potassium channel
MPASSTVALIKGLSTPNLTGRQNPSEATIPGKPPADRDAGDPVGDEYRTPALDKWRAATDMPLLVLAIGSLPVLLLETASTDLPRGDRMFIDIVNIVVLIAFGLDYVVELVVARRRAQYVRREWTNLLIVIAQILAVLPSFAAFGVLRIMRVSRVWRSVLVLARVVAISGAAAREGRSVLRRHAAGFALGFAGLTWLTSAVAFTLVEDVGETGRLHSFFDALWWASTTITTVGYGDVYPTTGAGRIVGVITMATGISAFAVVTAKVAEFLVRTGPEKDA